MERAPRLTRLFIALAWLAITTLGAVALLRFLYHDGTHLLTWLNAFTRYVYLPAYLCFIIACVWRRWWLAGTSLAIISCNLYWLAPDFVRDRRFESPIAATDSNNTKAQHLRIFFANVRADNREHDAMLREISEANADAIVLVEFSQHWNDAFRRSPLIAEYPYGSGMDLAQVNAVSILSKLPLKSDTREWFAGRCVETVAIQTETQTLRLVGIHAPRPMRFRGNDYEGFWRNVLPLLMSKQHPLVVVGDFNATQYSLVYQELKETGLRSAHEDRGRGYATTWPNGMLLVPPIRIDQALISSDVECLRIAEGEGRGSDHKPLILDVQLR